MLEEKENLNTQGNDVAEEKVIEQKIDLTPENIKKVKDAIAEEVRQEAGISDEESAAFREMLEEATMPVELFDKDFKLGANELDIRKLNKKNYDQMIFRTLVLQAVCLKNVQRSMVDLTRLIMIICDKLGIENIVKATDDIIVKITEQNEELKKIIHENSEKHKA